MILWEDFQQWDDGHIAELVHTRNYPRLGVYVPDGTRRLTLALTDCPPDGAEFYRAALNLIEGRFLQQLEMFFTTGVWGLVVPLFSRRVLARSDTYLRDFAEPVLQKLTQSRLWLDFYERHEVRVCFYGLQGLPETEFRARVGAWAEHLQAITSEHARHSLCLGVGGSAILGEDSARLDGSLELPDLREAFYGAALPMADFVIMSGKFGGLGALPPFICDGDTAFYIVPVPGLLLGAKGWRAILYDLLFQRQAQEAYPLTQAERLALRRLYEQNADSVIGTGQVLNGIWVARELQTGDFKAFSRTLGAQR